MPSVNFSSPGKNWPLCRFSAAVNASPPYFGEVQQHAAIDIARVDLFQAFEAALFPMAEQVAVQEAGPTGAAFEKRHVEAGEAARHAAEKHRLAGRVVGGGEMADMVVDEIRR